MKLSKKLLSMVLCGFITFGGMQSLSLIKADAFQEPRVWQVPIKIKLRAIHNRFYKQWRQIDLYCTNTGILQLQKSTTIPSNMTFDDTFMLGINNLKYGGITEYPLYLYQGDSNADRKLANEIDYFNAQNYPVGCPLFLHGKNWNDTLTLPSKMYLYQGSSNDYSQGYKSIDRWKTGFYTKWDGLHECIFMHSGDAEAGMSPAERYN